ncbi:MAG: TonB-dependent receptor [Burkholderiales bacterium]|nr:TonB-dependent receptor [Burkholderiales bacterium]
MKFEVTKLSLLVSGLFLASGSFAHAADAATDVGKITVQGQGDAQSQPGGTNTGLIQQEDAAKARSSVTRAYIEKQAPTSSPFQVIKLLPSVSTSDYDGTGLFGGSIRVRGFNSDQLGFTIDGVPVNDSGSFAVYPQEYVDNENMCDVFVTQGSTDTDAPHVGATGGNIGIVTCDPEDKRRVKLLEAFGSHHLWKSYVRFDSGRFADDKAKFFISYSKAEANKWRGEGRAEKEHVDMKARYDLSGGSYIDAGYLYNRQFNNNYLALTKAQIAQYGNYYDLGTTPPVHTIPVNGRPDDDTKTNPGMFGGGGTGYYGLSLNPFIDSIATIQTHWQFGPKASLDVEPYYWYGYGTGGNQLQSVQEGALTGSSLHGGLGDVNGDGDTLDKVMAYEGSLTKTERPGVNSKFSFDVANHHGVVGYWIERATHIQTGPYVRIDANGNPADPWLADGGQFIKQADGTPLEYRDTKTISTAHSLFAQDNISLMQDKLNLQLGVRDAEIHRDFHNYASAGGGGNPASVSSSGADYTVDKTYSKTLPSIGVRYQFTTEQSAYFNAAENFKAPGNFSYFNLLSTNTHQNVQSQALQVTGANDPRIVAGAPTIVNGVMVGAVQRDVPVTPEYSYDYDLGYRYAGEALTLSSALFYTDYRNRIASSYDENQQKNIDQNVGDEHQWGIELEAGYRLNKDWSVYGSLSYIKTHLLQDTQIDATHILPTSGKEMPDTPNWLAGFSLQYSHDNWDAMIEAKYTGKRYSTLVNDDSIGSYTIVGIGAGYHFASNSFFKNPLVRFNVDNLLNTNYLNLNGPSGSLYTNNAYTVNGIAGKVPAFYVGAPRSYTVTLSSDF